MFLGASCPRVNPLVNPTRSASALAVGSGCCQRTSGSMLWVVKSESSISVDVKAWPGELLVEEIGGEVGEEVGEEWELEGGIVGFSSRPRSRLRKVKPRARSLSSNESIVSPCNWSNQVSLSLNSSGPNDGMVVANAAIDASTSSLAAMAAPSGAVDPGCLQWLALLRDRLRL